MGIQSLSIKAVRHCGLQQQHQRRAAFSLCIVLIIQQSVALSLPQPSAASSSLALISMPQLNDDAPMPSHRMALELADEEHPTRILTPGQIVINAVPVQDRHTFFDYQLAVGLRTSVNMQNETLWLQNLEDVIDYVERQLPHLKDVPIYENFASDLLRWLMEKFNLLPEDVYNQLRSRSRRLCTSSGVCYSPNDVVCFCCPF